MGNIKSVYVSIPAFEIATKTNGWLYAQLQSALRNELSDDFGAIESFQAVGFSEDNQAVMFKVSTEIPERRSIKMTLEERLDTMSRLELFNLYFEAEALHKTGQLPGDAKLRQLSQEILDSSMVLQMTTVAYNVYRKIAELYMDTNDD